jgi:hypothetical protein
MHGMAGGPGASARLTGRVRACQPRRSVPRPTQKRHYAPLPERITSELTGKPIRQGRVSYCQRLAGAVALRDRRC